MSRFVTARVKDLLTNKQNKAQKIYLYRILIFSPFKYKK